MKKVKVKSLLGISGVAEIEIQDRKITMLVGENAQGKSNIINLAKAALLPRALPEGMSKKDYGQALVNDACKEGEVVLESPGLKRVVNYPDCEVKTISGSQSCKFDEWAAQEYRLPYLTAAAKGMWLSKVTQSKPTEQELFEQLDPLNILPSSQEKLLKIYKSSGPETALAVATDFAKEIKLEFKALTGEQWYVNKAVLWKPKGYTDDLEKTSVVELEVERTRTEAEYQSNKERAALFRAAGNKEELLAEVETWTTTLMERETELKAAQAFHDHHQKRKNIVTCEGCGLEGIVDGTKLTKTQTTESPPDPSITLEQAKNAVGNAQMALGLAKGNLDKAEGMGEPVDLKKYSDAWDLARTRFEAAKKKHESMALHYRVVDMLKACDIVSPDGLAKAKLLIGVKEFNKKLREYSELAGWEAVQIDKSLNLTYDNRAYHPHILSESERFRADVTFQVAYAIATEQELVLIDRADLLDVPGREGLLNLLYGLDMTAVVGMTAAGSDVPNLEEMGIGTTYIVKRGTVVRMGAMSEAAATA